MAQPIQVPQTTPNAPQFQVPTDLVNAYLNRQAQAPRDIAESLNNTGDVINRYHQQRIQNQLAALQARVMATRQLGPEMSNQIYAGQNPTPPGAIPLQGTPQNATVPTVQDQTPSPYIQASLAQGHPDVAGVGSFHSPTPDVSGFQNQASQLNQKLGQYSNQGDYGREQSQQVSGQLQGLKTEADMSLMPQTIAKNDAEIRAANAKFVTPDQANALSSGDPGQVSAQFGKGATVPVEAVQFTAGQRQQKQNKSQEIEKSYQDKNVALENAIQAINSSLELKRKAGSAQGPIKGSIASVVGDVTHGAMQDPIFQLNRNNELQRSTLQHVQEVNRFNPQEVGYIGGGALAQPGEPLKVSEEKAAQAIKVLNQRLQQNLVQKNAELGAQGLPASKENFGESTGVAGPHGPTVVQNGHTYKWNGKQYE